MSTKSKNIKSSSKTSKSQTEPKAIAAKNPNKKSATKKVEVPVVAAPVEIISPINETLVVEPDVVQTVVSVNTDTPSGAIAEVQTELPLADATPTPTVEVAEVTQSACCASTEHTHAEVTPQKDNTRIILIVAGAIVVIAMILSGILG